MTKYKLHPFMRGIDWYLFSFLVVFIPLACLSFMAAAILILIVKQNLKESLEMAIFFFLCIVMEQYFWEIYAHVPHVIFVDEEQRCLYLKRIFGKLWPIRIREIQQIRTHFWFSLIYYPTFMGYKKVEVPESVFPGGFFIISPFFRKRKELLDTILEGKS